MSEGKGPQGWEALSRGEELAGRRTGRKTQLFLNSLYDSRRTRGSHGGGSQPHPQGPGATSTQAWLQGAQNPGLWNPGSALSHARGRHSLCPLGLSGDVSGDSREGGPAGAGFQEEASSFPAASRGPCFFRAPEQRG